MENNKRLKNAEHVAWRVLDEETVVLDTTDGHYFTLNPTATVVWLALVEGRTLGEAVDELCQNYDVEPKQALLDAESSVATWLSEGLLLDIA